LSQDLEKQFVSYEAQREESFLQEEERQMKISQTSEIERTRQFGESETTRERAFQYGQETRLEKSNWYAKVRDELTEFNKQARNRGYDELEVDMKSRFSTILRSQEESFKKEESLRDELVDELVSLTNDICCNCLTDHLVGRG